jgi:ABC-type proline/glycine betaine transport system permease subunit
MSAYQHVGLFIIAVGAGILLGALLAAIIRHRAERQAESSARSLSLNDTL